MYSTIFGKDVIILCKYCKQWASEMNNFPFGTNMKNYNNRVYTYFSNAICFTVKQIQAPLPVICVFVNRKIHGLVYDDTMIAEFPPSLLRSLFFVNFLLF